MLIILYAFLILLLLICAFFVIHTYNSVNSMEVYNGSMTFGINNIQPINFNNSNMNNSAWYIDWDNGTRIDYIHIITFENGTKKDQNINWTYSNSTIYNKGFQNE